MTASTARCCCCAAAQSDLLSSATALEMTQRGPKPHLVEIPNVGHAPALMDPAQIRIIEGFLRL